jgi:hypothetical protein
MKCRRLHRAVLALTLVLGLAAGLWQVVPPNPPANSTPTEFDNAKAFAHVRAMAKEPHPNGSPANAAVREYLLAELRKLDLAPEIQTRQVRRHWDNSVRTVHNILARIPAASGPHDDALLVAAHYDSSSISPGAGDDAAGVAAILETLRALKAANHAPTRDIIILLSDGEELGLLGAMAFCGDPLGDPARVAEFSGESRPVKESAAPITSTTWPPHPWLNDIALVLNFEARGAAGASIMFETAPGTLGLVRDFARADPLPAASSISYEVYKLIRNDTDFTIFRRAGKRGLNFAFAADQLRYHRRTDTPENLSKQSLYHHGEHVLALTRHFTSRPETQDPRAGIWFNVWRGRLVWYPQSWVWPLTILQVALVAGAIVHAWRRRAISGLGLVGATLRVLLSLCLAYACVLTMRYFLVRPGPVREPWHFEAFAALFASLAAAVTVACMVAWRRSTLPADLTAVALILWTILSVLATRYAPGATYLTHWPAIFAAACLVAETTWPRRPVLRTTSAALSMFPALLLLPPTIYLGFVALTLDMSAFIAPVIALVTTLVAPAFIVPTRDPSHSPPQPPPAPATTPLTAP